MRPFDPLFILEALAKLFPFLGVTLSILFGTVFIGTLLGAALAIAKIKKKKGLKQLAEVYTLVLRCTPPIVLLFLVYYGLPELIENTFGTNINHINKGIFVIIALSLLFAATMSEVIRTSYEAIEKGQYEAAASVGMSEFQIFRRIMLPQCVVIMLPNFGNSLIALMKEGALAYSIGFIDLMGKGQLLIGTNYGAYALETYLALAVIYWGLTLIIEKILTLCETRLFQWKRSI